MEEETHKVDIVDEDEDDDDSCEIVDEKPMDDNEETFRAIVREVRAASKGRGRGKVRGRGRPRKGTPKIINEKKILTELRRELGLREDRAKEFGFFDTDDQIGEH